jgi:hypothetical protein
MLVYDHTSKQTTTEKIRKPTEQEVVWDSSARSGRE